jgi:hypothetical protein
MTGVNVIMNRAEPALYYYDCPIRIPADFPYTYIPQDNAAFLLFVAAMKPTSREVIQADPKFPHGKHDSKIECEYRLESFIYHMLDQDPACKKPRWQTYNPGMLGPGDPVYAVWFVRRLIDYLKVGRRLRRNR